VAEVTFSGTYLTTISSTVGASAILTYENITGLSNGPLHINIRCVFNIYNHCKTWPLLIERVIVMVYTATFNNFSVISWRSVLIMEETRYPEKTINLPQVTDKLSHNVVSSTPRLSRIRTCNVSGESNYYAITTTTAPILVVDVAKLHI
jgi:hypothetical protein